MKIAIITNGVVSNICEGDEGFAGMVNGVVSDAANIGDAYANGLFTSPVPNLGKAQTAQLALMESSYQSANTAPIAYMSTTFQSDANSQSLMAAVLTASGGSLPAGFAWFDVNNAPVAMTFAQLQGLAGTILLRGQPLFIHKQAQKASIRAALDVATTLAVVW